MVTTGETGTSRLVHAKNLDCANHVSKDISIFFRGHGVKASSHGE